MFGLTRHVVTGKAFSSYEAATGIVVDGRSLLKVKP